MMKCPNIKPDLIHDISCFSVAQCDRHGIQLREPGIDGHSGTHHHEVESIESEQSGFSCFPSPHIRESKN